MTQDRFPAALDFLWRKDTDGQAIHHDPNDRGGATSHGVILTTWAAWRAQHGHQTTTKADLANATNAELAEMIRAWFWQANRCQDMPPGVDLMMLDVAFGSGPASMAKMLQRIVGVTADGNIGPATIAAVKAYPVGSLIDAIHLGWLNWCRRIPDPGGWPTYQNGWTNRANKRREAARQMASLTPGLPAMPATPLTKPVPVASAELSADDRLNEEEWARHS